MNKISLEVNGTVYEGFKSIFFTKSIEEVSGEFNFETSLHGSTALPFKGGEKCVVMAGSAPVITGFIDQVNYAYSGATHSVSVVGRDKTADIVDSTVDGNVDFKAPISLTDVCQRVIAGIGADISVINAVPTLEKFNDNELVVAAVNENAFAFLDKYARKRGVLLSSNGDGDLVIARRGNFTLSGVLQNNLNGVDNNIKSATISYDLSNRLHKYVVRSQGNPVSIETAQDLGLTSVESTEGVAFDEEIRNSRVLVLQAETTSTGKTAQERAQWEANVRRTRSQVYTCEVTSIFSSANELYLPNLLIRVKDEFSDIDSLMLIQSLTYNLGEKSGTSVTLTLVPNDSYSLTPTVKPIDSLYNKVGERTISFAEPSAGEVDLPS